MQPAGSGGAAKKRGSFVLASRWAPFFACGMFSRSGGAAFEEMAGMIPFFAGVAAVPVAAVSGICRLVARWR